ncbi:MAG TPA: amidohydrolase family protein, partial [bacterium]|nr:amidohydrolase family protein [bacterium]
ATINAAHAIGAAEEVGSLEPGKAADAVILEMTDYRELPMAFGTNPVRAVIKRGRVVRARS